MKNPTTREIAKKAGVSPAAVSLALNGKKGISEDTRKTILKIAQSMNYNPQGNRTRENKRKTARYNIAVLFRTDLNSMDQLFYNELNLCSRMSSPQKMSTELCSMAIWIKL